MSDFSVIVPVYYGEDYVSNIIGQIESCKKYLKREDYIEILFVNDAPDAPLSLEWNSEIVDIKIINTDRNLGIHATRLKGLELCKGEYILFLDQDDRIKPNYFHSQMQKLGDGDAVVCKALHGGKPLYIDDKYFINIPNKHFALKEWNLIVSPGQVLLKRNSISDNWIKNVIKNNGADDWFLWICMYAEKSKFSLNEEILYEHILQNSNMSDDIICMLRSEQEVRYIIQEKKILSDYDFKLFLEGFDKRNFIRTKELYFAKKKLDIIDRWRKLKQNNIKFCDNLFRLKIQTIAIYGCGILGEFLYDELKTITNIKYFIDNNAQNIQKEVPVYALSEQLPPIDLVIITLVAGEKEVKCELENRKFKNIIILKEWLLNDWYI